MTAQTATIFAPAIYEQLAAKYGTPFYLYNADAVAERISYVRDAFQGLVDIYYAVKANPNLELLRSVRDVADGLDISSEGELEQSCLAGFDAAALSFAGPGKTRDELKHAVVRGVGCISVESIRELEDLIAVAAEARRLAHVLLRVNPSTLIRAFGLKMGGKATQFGIDEETLADAIDLLRNNTDWIDFQGIHVYAGSQCFEWAAAAEGMTDTLRMAGELERSTGLTCRVINLGGGFGVSHGPEPRELDVHALAKQLLPAIREWHGRSDAPRRLVVELGRFLTARAGTYVIRAISEKHSRGGKKFLVADGGLNHHLSAAGSFGVSLRSNFEICNLTRPKAEPQRLSIAGPSCNPTDLLGIDVELPGPKIGDLLGIMNSGSYGMTASPLLFLGRQTPAEVIHRNGEFWLGRRSMHMTEFN